MGGAGPTLEKISGFLESLSTRQISTIGLSIGSSSIKIVELQMVKKSWKLLHFGVVQLPDDVIVNREIVNQIAVVDAVKTLISQLKLKTKAVCTSISGTSMIIKRMRVEVPNLSELKEQVYWEAEQYLPFDVNEVVMDYHLVSRTKDNKFDVLLVAVKRSVMDSYIQSIEGSGLRAKIVDIDFFALQHVYEANYPSNQSEAVALVDIGASALKMTIVHAGVPVFTKDTALGGKNLTSEIQKQLSLSFADAESLKVGGHTNGMPQEVNDLIRIMSDNFATEIKRAVDFYNASSTGAPVASILITGGGAKILDLSKTIEEHVGLPTQIMNPFNAISYDPNVFTQDYITAIAPIAAIPIGLALRAGAK
jgi:type IV pilus assembly protein PilM